MSLSFPEDKAKSRAVAVKLLLAGGLAFLAGLYLLFWLPRRGYVEAALGGSLLGGGGAALGMAVIILSRLGKEPVVLLAADDAGVTLATGRTTSRTIPWAEIRSVSARNKGIQRGVAFEIADPDAYLARLSPAERKQAKQNRRFFGSPVSVNTLLCATPNAEIAARLSSCMPKPQ